MEWQWNFFTDGYRNSIEFCQGHWVREEKNGICFGKAKEIAGNSNLLMKFFSSIKESVAQSKFDDGFFKK